MLDYQRVLCSCFRYMNMNCVIFPSNLDSPLENWMDGKDNKLTSKYRARLKTCVDRALASSKRSDFRKRFPRCPKRIQKVFLEFLDSVLPGRRPVSSLLSGPILCHFCRQGCSPLWFYVISIIIIWFYVDMGVAQAIEEMTGRGTRGLLRLLND